MRDLHRNNAYVKRYVNLLKTNIVGSMGIKLQAQVIDRTRLRFCNAQIEETLLIGVKRLVLLMVDLPFRHQKLVMENLAIDGEVLIQVLPNAKNDFGLQSM